MFRNLMRMFCSEINTSRTEQQEGCTTPPIESKIPVKFKSDVEALEKKFGPLKDGMKIELSLTEALELIPRDRKRTDAYKALQKYLSERGVNLVVKSQKTKKK